MPKQVIKGAPEPIAALNKVKILEYSQPLESREPLVDVRIVCPEVVWQEHVCPFLRKTVAEMVNAAAASLPSGYKLRAGTALRTLHMQKGGWDNYFKRMKEEHPEWPLSALRRATNKYFAPYDQPAPPGHCTGGAIDVGLLDSSGQPLDMIAPTSGWEAAYTWSDKISTEAKKNRMIMVDAMLGAGFSNCRDEYWHYSYGDSAWAVRTGVSTCPYGWAYAKPETVAEFGGACAKIVNLNSNRDNNGRYMTVELGVSATHAQADLAFGLLWLRDCSISLQIQHRQWLKNDFHLLMSTDKTTWVPLVPSSSEDSSITFQFKAEADKLYFSSKPPQAEDPQQPV